MCYIVRTLTEAVQESGEKLAAIFNKKDFPAKVDLFSTCTRCEDSNYDESCKVPHSQWEYKGNL